MIAYAEAFPSESAAHCFNVIRRPSPIYVYYMTTMLVSQTT